MYLTFKIPVSNNGEVDIEKAEQIIRDEAPDLAITEIIKCTQGYPTIGFEGLHDPKLFYIE